MSIGTIGWVSGESEIIYCEQCDKGLREARIRYKKTGFRVNFFLLTICWNYKIILFKKDLYGWIYRNKMLYPTEPDFTDQDRTSVLQTIAALLCQQGYDFVIKE